MKRIGIDQIAEAVGGRIVGPPNADQQTASGVSTDSRATQPGDLFVALVGPRFDGHDFLAAAVERGAAGAIVSRAVDVAPADGRPFAQILVRDTVAALGRLAAWYRKRLTATVVAVTGSNGKTTTKSMIEHMMSRDHRLVASPKSFNNNIGLPLTLLSADSSHDLIIAEVGSNAPGEIDLLGRIASPNIGVIVGISETHLERLRSLDGVATEKASLLGTLAPGGVGIVNGDRPQLLAAARNYNANLIRFGNDPQGELVLGELIATANGIRFTVNGADRVELPVLGAHNATNALAAIAVGRRLGLSVAEAAARLADFKAPPMRLERVSVNGIELINDAYNANPASMAAALDVFADLPWHRGRKVFVCGDMLELGGDSEAFHYQLGQRIASAGVGTLLAVGAQSPTVVQGARQAGMSGAATFQFADTPSLLEQVGRLLADGDLVLLKASRGMALERVITALGDPVSRGGA